MYKQLIVMKRNFLLAVAMIFGATVYGQFYTSVSGGYGFEFHKSKVGAEQNLKGERTDINGSFGAGFQTQVRAGYFFTDRWGVELALGYLHGKEITTVKSPLATSVSKSNVFGASLSAVFNVTESIYLRAGGVTKIGGSSKINTTLNIPTPIGSVNAEIVSKTTGKMPFGFIGGLGYRFKLTPKVSLFVEGEYININVSPDKMKLESFSGSIGSMGITSEQLATQLAGRLGKDNPLLAYLQNETSVANQKKSPYSSLGANIGLIYHF